MTTHEDRLTIRYAVELLITNVTTSLELLEMLNLGVDDADLDRAQARLNQARVALKAAFNHVDEIEKRPDITA